MIAVEDIVAGAMQFGDVALSSPATELGDVSQELSSVLEFDLFPCISLNAPRCFLAGLWGSAGRAVQ